MSGSARNEDESRWPGGDEPETGDGTKRPDAGDPVDEQHPIPDDLEGFEALKDLDPALLADLGLGDWGESTTVSTAEFDKVAKERLEYLDALRHLQADFDNFRKRSIRQQTQLVERATEQLCTELLPVLDACDLALAHVAELGDKSDSAKALGQIAALLRDSLAREGVQRIDAVGVPFDPTVHDAVGHLPAEPPDEAEPSGTAEQSGTAKPSGRAKPSGQREPAGDDVVVESAPAPSRSAPPVPTVAEVLRPGYALKAKVLRPAMVTVRG